MRSRFLQIAVLVAVLMMSAVAVLPVFAQGPVTTDAIAGTWYGNMRFSNVNSVERIKVVVPAGCQSGDVCGSLQNFPVQCTWEITYDGYSDGAYEYHFSDTLSGDCPAGSAGSLTSLADGTLYRVHTTPAFTVSGLLRQRPNAGN